MSKRTKKQMMMVNIITNVHAYKARTSFDCKQRLMRNTKEQLSNKVLMVVKYLQNVLCSNELPKKYKVLSCLKMSNGCCKYSNTTYTFFHISSCFRMNLERVGRYLKITVILLRR